jgi:hypothetical protein
MVRRRSATLSFPFTPEKQLGFRVPFSIGLNVRFLSRVLNNSD